MPGADPRPVPHLSGSLINKPTSCRLQLCWQILVLGYVRVGEKKIAKNKQKKPHKIPHKMKRPWMSARFRRPPSPPQALAVLPEKACGALADRQEKGGGDVPSSTAALFKLKDS